MLFCLILFTFSSLFYVGLFVWHQKCDKYFGYFILVAGPFKCLFVCFGFVLFLNKTILICYLILFTFSSSFLFLFICLKSLQSFDEMSG